MKLTLQKRGTITVTRKLREKPGVKPGDMLKADV